MGPQETTSFEDFQMEGSDVSLDFVVVQKVVSGDPRPSWIVTERGHLIWANEVAQASRELPWMRLYQTLPWSDIIKNAKGLVPLSVNVGQDLQYEVLLLPRPVGGGDPLYLIRPATVVRGEVQFTPGENSAHQPELERLSRLSHDLRVPLQSLMLACDSFEHQADAAQQMRQIKSITKLALDQVTFLLDEHKKSQAAELPSISFNLTDLAHDVVNILRPLCHKNGNDIRIEGGSAPVWVQGDPRPIRAILQNLMSNSNRFTQNSEILLRVLLGRSTLQGKDQIVFEVHDKGPGLSAEQKSVLGDPNYWRNPRQFRREISFGGYGLGMQIVSQAVAELSGVLSITDGENGGAIFRVAFELSPGERPREPDVQHDAKPLEGLRLLLVEDNMISASILSRMIGSAGAEVEAVHCGQDALERMISATVPFDIVLLDVSLPDIDGIEVAQRFGEQCPTSKSILIGLTAHEDPAIHTACRAAGMSFVLLKPISPQDLRQCLKSQMGHNLACDPSKTYQAPVEVIDEIVVAGLIDELGAESTISFMTKALAEAQELARQCRAGLDVIALRQALHSAVGSTGLTGLTAVEAGLRQLQDAVRSEGNRTQAFLKLELALVASEQKLRQL